MEIRLEVRTLKKTVQTIKAELLPNHNANGSQDEQEQQPTK